MPWCERSEKTPGRIKSSMPVRCAWKVACWLQTLPCWKGFNFETIKSSMQQMSRKVCVLKEIEKRRGVLKALVSEADQLRRHADTIDVSLRVTREPKRVLCM